MSEPRTEAAEPAATPSAEDRMPIDRPLLPENEVTDEELASLQTAEVTPESRNPQDQVVAIAKGQIGYREKAGNRTKYGEWYGMNGEEWCDIFVSWVFHVANQLSAIGGKSYNVDVRKAWCVKRKVYHHRGAKGGGPRIGCLIFFDFNRRSGPDHIGIVIGYNDTYVYTVEGNRGNKVSRCKYRRDSRDVLGYGYPEWARLPR